MIFGAKKIDVNRVEDNSRQDLALITQMNQELAGSLDLKETLQNALELIKKLNPKPGLEISKKVKLFGFRDTNLKLFNQENIEKLINKNLIEKKLLKPIYLS